MIGSTALMMLALAGTAALDEQPAQRIPADTALWRRMLAAEDARGQGEEGVAPLREGRRAADAELRAWAVRALGRLEADSLLAYILDSLDDADADVRAQAANAAAQAVVRGDPARARSALLERASRETDARVLGVIAEALGRLATDDSSAVRETAQTLLALSYSDSARTAGTRTDTAHGGKRSSAQPGAAGREVTQRSAIAAPPTQLIGAVRGLYFLARQSEARDVLPDSVAPRLVELAAYGRKRTPDTPDTLAAPSKAADDTTSAIVAGADTAAAAAADSTLEAENASVAADTAERDARRVRTVAVAALVASGTATQEQLAAVLGDPDPYVRREAAAGAGELDDRSAARQLAERALDDESGMVRLEGLRLLGRIADDADACERTRAATQDPSAHVALLAIDLLGTPRCAIRPGIAQLLDREVRTLPPATPDDDAARPPGSSTRGGWHRAAHAIVALSTADPARARRRLPAFVEHSDFFVRTYAARAASALGDVRTLRRLAADAHPNVRTEAVGALRAHAGHAADSLYIAQLTQDDSQLLQAAAAALAGSNDPGARPALLDALDRVSAARRETSRDARRALLERIAELGRPTDADRIEAYLRDFDPEIAAQAAGIIEAWTGTRPDIEPAEPPPTLLPALDELSALADARVIIEIAAETAADMAAETASETAADTIELRLLPFVAPTNVARFVRLAREGYYDGLKFHRIAPNFVVQGGSPRANEYAGDGPYTRDELGLIGNWRGTVGLSTRGRDTGDAQLYINLIDNVRLDHDYTVWAEVVTGMDVVDRLLEGAVIRQVTVQ